MFIFSSSDFNQAYNRFKYFQQIQDYSNRQIELIERINDSLAIKNKQLDSLKYSKNTLLSTIQTKNKEYETEKLIVNNTSFNGTNIDGLLRFINSLTGLNKDSDDVKGLTLSGKETSSETITFDNCIGRNEQGKSVNLATYIDPSDEECAYLYSSGDPAAWKNGVKSITITPTNNGGNKVVLVLYKEEYGTETNSSEANYHRGFATTIASLGQFTSGTRIENQLTSVGDTTITAVINANGTLDSYQVSSPYTMKMKSPVNGLVGINSFGMQIKGNLTSAYTFTR
jgi:hypothetical protein